jgi:DNA primase
MPSIDFAALRSTISLAQVLASLNFNPVGRSGDELRGPCTVHESSSPTSRSFSADLRKNTWNCFRCGAGGNQLDLWAATQKLPIYAAALDLCERLAIPLPQFGRSTSSANTRSEKRSP